MSRRAVAAAIAIAGFVAGLFPIFDGDIFWHLAAGRWIVEHGAVPRLDPFRFGAERLPWVDHEWLFQVVAFGLERAVGLDGLIVVRAAALAGFALLIFFVCRRARIGDGLAGLVALGALLGVRPRFLDRPEIVTLFAVVLLLLLLEEEEEEKRIHRGKRPSSDVVFAGSQRSLPALLVPFGLVVVWVNFHGEAMLAPVLAGLFLLGAAVEERAAGLGDGRNRWREIVAVPALLAAALLVN
ncbi:MAG TPA: hypothetical protein VI942_04800, partial [Thermoanaerobaculia bacterium]|nr:hypothetical protein [Thermoanaerobaculia bacterium]